MHWCLRLPSILQIKAVWFIWVDGLKVRGSALKQCLLRPRRCDVLLEHLEVGEQDPISDGKECGTGEQETCEDSQESVCILCVLVYARVHLYVYVNVHVYAYVYMYVYMYVYRNMGVRVIDSQEDVIATGDVGKQVCAGIIAGKWQRTLVTFNPKPSTLNPQVHTPSGVLGFSISG